jgi:hypothetical protein
MNWLVNTIGSWKLSEVERGVEEARGQVEALRDVSFIILYIQFLMILYCLS